MEAASEVASRSWSGGLPEKDDRATYIRKSPTPLRQFPTLKPFAQFSLILCGSGSFIASLLGINVALA